MAFSSLKAIRSLGLATVVATMVPPSASLAQAGEPDWVTKIWLDALKACDLSASEFRLHLVSEAGPLKVEFSPTISDGQKRCIRVALRYVKVISVDGLPILSDSTGTTRR